MKLHIYYVYILTNFKKNVLYTGVTNDLVRRCHEHKNKLVEGFTQRYNVNNLVYYEYFNFIEDAIKRKKQIKKYTREQKEKLISANNPLRVDLYNNGKISSLKNITETN